MGIMTSVGTLLRPKNAKTTELEESKVFPASCAPEMCQYSAFNISVVTPGDWTITPDHRGRDFCFENGYYKFEKTYSDTAKNMPPDSVSFGLRWETTEQGMDNETFITTYAKNMEEQYQRYMKKSRDFQFENSEVVELNGGVKSCLMRVTYRANNKMFGKGGRRVSVSNIAFLHEGSRRRIIATVMAIAKRMEEERENLEGILYSIKAV